VKPGNEDRRLGSREALKEPGLQSNSMEEERWQKLEVYKLSDDLAYSVYQATKNFPKEEIYGLTSQIRRSALSIPTNIVEGYSRKGDKELSRFINISLGSLAETKYLLYFSNRLGYLKPVEYDDLKNGYDKLGKLLWKFYEAIGGK
jgi:four helix bundle protein